MNLFNQYDIFLKENMDLKDQETLHTIAVALEADQDQLLAALTSQLYDKIQEKASKIDYSTITRSRGDITKVENYNTLMECISIIRNIVLEYKQDTAPVDIVSVAVENITNRTSLFKKAFTLESPMPILIYNNITMAIVTSVSFLIATTIEYIKSPGSDTFQIALDTVAYNRTKDNLLFENLKMFNKACNSKELDQSLDIIMSQSRVRREAVEEVPVAHDSPFMTDEDIFSDKKTIVHDNNNEDKDSTINEGMVYNISRAVVFIMKMLINIIRSFVYFFFNTKQHISDYFAVQAELLEMNAYKLQYNNTINDNDRKKIYDKQMKISGKFRKWSNKFNIDYSSSKKFTNDMINDDTKKYKVSELRDYNPNSEEKNPYQNSILF